MKRQAGDLCQRRPTASSRRESRHRCIRVAPPPVALSARGQTYSWYSGLLENYGLPPEPCRDIGRRATTLYSVVLLSAPHEISDCRPFRPARFSGRNGLQQLRASLRSRAGARAVTRRLISASRYSTQLTSTVTAAARRFPRTDPRHAPQGRRVGDKIRPADGRRRRTQGRLAALHYDRLSRA